MNRFRAIRFLIIGITCSLTLLCDSFNASSVNLLSEDVLSGANSYKNEWVNIDDSYYYYDINGNIIINDWLKYANEWYHVDIDGKMETNKWVSDIAGDWFYLGEDGKMQKSKWIDDLHYVNGDGKMLKSVTTVIGNTIYTFDNNGLGTKKQTEISGSKVYASGNSSASSRNNSNAISNNKQFNAKYNESNTNSGIVYIPKKGKKYHSKPSCSNMKNPTEVSESTAISRGYTRCSKCW